MGAGTAPSSWCGLQSVLGQSPKAAQEVKVNVVIARNHQGGWSIVCHLIDVVVALMQVPPWWTGLSRTTLQSTVWRL